MKENKATTQNDAETLNINADADAPGNPQTDDIDADSLEHERLLGELEEQKDKYLRLFAEFDNFKRRSAKERIELIQTAGKDVIIGMLPVLDDCNRAEIQINNSSDPDLIREGVALVFNKLRNTLQARGLKPMESLHETFDVEKHEAITEIEVPADQKGKVVDEIEKGYSLNGKLIRFAKVVVGK